MKFRQLAQLTERRGSSMERLAGISESDLNKQRVVLTSETLNTSYISLLSGRV